MTRGTPPQDAESALASAITANDAPASIAENQREQQQQQQQTPSTVSRGGEGKESSEPQESESGNLGVATIIHRDEASETGSSNEVPDEGKETNQTGKREANNQSAGEKIMGNAGERETASTKAKGQLDDDNVETGNRGANDKSADDLTNEEAGDSVIGKGVTQGVDESDILIGERETKATERVKDKGHFEDTGESREKKDNDQSADMKMADAESVRGNQEQPENVDQQQVMTGGREEPRSSKTVKTKVGGTETSKSSGDGNQVGGDRIETEKGEDNIQSVQRDMKHAEIVKPVKKRRIKEHQVLEGDLGAGSSGDKKRQSNICESGEGGDRKLPGNEKKAETSFKQHPQLSESIKKISKGENPKQVRKEREIDVELNERNDIPPVEGRVAADGVAQDRSEADSVEQEGSTKGGPSSRVPNARTEVVAPKVARKQISVDQRKRKGAGKPSEPPLLPAAVPETLQPNVDRISGAAATAHSEEYRLQMAARNLLMHSAPPSYLSGMGLPPPPPYYSAYYPPTYPAPYLHPYMVHPLPHHPLHPPHPHAAAPYAVGSAVPPHVLPLELTLEVEARRALAESRNLGSSVGNVPIARRSTAEENEAEAEMLRAAPAAHDAARYGWHLGLGPSMYSHLAAFDPVSGIQPSAQAAEVGGVGLAVLKPRTSGAALGFPPPPIAAASMAKKPLEPEIDEDTMDKVTLDRVRRDRKNAQSRNRAAKLRLKLEQIQAKPEDERTKEEQQLWEEYEARREKKNSRSRNRAEERKQEIERILALPEEARTPDDIKFLELYTGQKKRKIHGDRLRRARMKQLGFAVNEKVPGITARGPLPPEYLRALQADRAQEHSEDEDYTE